MDFIADLGIQSFCFRHFPDNAQIASLVRECGVNKIELSALNVDLDDEASWSGVLAAYQNAGVEVVSFGVQKFAADEAAETKAFEFARCAGAKFLSGAFPIESTPQSFRVAEKLAERYDMHIGIHNKGGKNWTGNSQTLRDVFGKTNERIGLCLDTAWAQDAREEPIGMAYEFGKRLYGLHLKDFVFDRAGRPSDVIIGEGNLNLPILLGNLKEANYNGFAVLEYEGDVENPVPALKQCVEAVRRAVEEK